MRVRLLDEDYRRVVLAWWAADRHAEAVEATPAHRRLSPVTNPEQRRIKTCPACGTTGTIGGTFYESNPCYCKACTTAKINAHIHRVNELTRTTAENHRQPWSELEVEMLLGGVADGMSGQDLAEMLGRTYPTSETHTVSRANTICPACHLQKPCFCD
jgi:hypothetical protein